MRVVAGVILIGVKVDFFVNERIFYRHEAITDGNFD